MQRDLVLGAQAGDHSAFTALAAASLSRLHRTARLILRDDDRASDAVQDALTTAWLDIRAVRDPDRFDAWLHRLLVRACYRVAGRERRQRVLEIRIDPREEPQSGDAGPAVALRDQLERGFRRLTPEQRAVLAVHHYLGLPDAEAADVLRVPLGTFKSRLNRATLALRAALEAESRMGEIAEEVLA
jgi:RNA polymerase sigma factor (sigma-70 family)